MKKIYAGLLIAGTLLTGGVNAQNQRGCETMQYFESQKLADPGLEARMQQIEAEIQDYINANPSQRNQAVITIPVVFHIVYSTSAQNISDARIMAQLDVLNKDYARLNADAGSTPSVFQGVSANTNIQFCLAQRDPNGNATTGINRKQTTTSSFSTNDNIKRSANGGVDPWPASSYLNIWSGNLSGGVLGYAQFPGAAAATDGVVLLYSSIGGPSAPGTATPYHLGRTATHEVGHWLNLRHIWGDASCGNDLVSDTPTSQTSNFGCPSFPHVTCSNGPNGDMFMNYMDYTNDACMNMFTAGQSARMNATLAGTRASLQTSLGCTPPSGGGSCGTPGSLASGSITSSSATLSWGAVSGATSYNVQYKTAAATTYTNATVTTTSLALTGLSANTAYVYNVRAVCGATTGSYSTQGTFTTLSASGCTDTYESNNTSGTAKTIAVNTDINALISSTSDVDWFKFTTTSPNTNIQVTLTNLPFDYDVRLYNSNVSTLATGQNGGTTSESIIRNSSTATTYYVRVYGYNGAMSTTSCYKLRINASSSPFRLEDNMTNANKAELLSGVVAVPNPATDQTSFEFITDASGISDVSIMDMTGKLVYSGKHEVIEGINKLDFNVGNYTKGIYLIMISQNGDRRTGKFIVQ